MGQGQSQQSAPADEGQTRGYDSSSQPEPQPDSRLATVDATPAVEQHDASTEDDHAMQHDQSTETETDDLVTATKVDSAQVETFKVPGLPAKPPPPVETPALPADMAHIVALGANQPETKDADARGASAAAPSREIADVVKELKAKAAMQVDSEMNTAARTTGELSEGAGPSGKKSDELVKVEREMEMMGVKRDPTSEGVPRAEEGELGDVANASREEDVKMGGNASSSDSDTDSLSSDSDSTTAAPVARQRQRRGRNQRATSPSSDMGDDDDDESGVVSSKIAPKTEHEIIEPEVALPTVQKIDEAVELAKFGKVESVIENVVVIRADTGGDWRVLDEGTVVCLEDRAVIGQIFETFGSVQQPFYSIRFPAAAPPDPSVFTIGRPTFYAPNLASFVFTRDLRAMKGSDASNIWDEEVAAHEMEFSDDEEEAEYRRRQKADRRSRTQSATPGPSGRAARQSATPAPVPRASPAPSSLLPARPSVSYADALEPSSFTTPSLPSAAPMSAAPAASTSRAAFGDKPPPGRVGRKMFERDSGMTLEPGEEVEFEFSSGEGSGSDGEDEGARMQSGPAAPRGGAGGRGAGRGAQRGDRGRGRGRGRGRDQGRGGGGGGVERQVAPLPARAGGAGGFPAGLPSRPAFETDFGPEGNADAPVRMSSTPAAVAAAAGPAEGSAAPPAPFAFGAAATSAAAQPQADFRFQPASHSPKQAASPSTRSPAMRQPSGPRGGNGASGSPYQQQQGRPWSASDGSVYSPHSPAGPPAGAAAYGYRPQAAYPGAAQPPYYQPGPPPATGAYGGYNPAAPYPAGPGAGPVGYSPHSPSWSANSGYGPPAPPVADPRGGHINPRFLPAGQAPPPPPHQGGPAPPSSGPPGAAGWYGGGGGGGAPYGGPPPPSGGSYW